MKPASVIIEEYVAAYEAEHGKKPTVNKSRAWANINGNNYRIRDLPVMTETLKARTAMKAFSATPEGKQKCKEHVVVCVGGDIFRK